MSTPVTGYGSSHLVDSCSAQLPHSFLPPNIIETEPLSRCASEPGKGSASAGEPPKRLVGWSKVKLNPGESREVALEVDQEYLSIFNVDKNVWQLIPGDYAFFVGGSSRSLPLNESVSLK